MELMTLPAAARKLELSPRTLRGQARRGKFAAFQVGRVWLVDQAEVDRYATQNKGRAKGSPLSRALPIPMRPLTPHKRTRGDWKVQATVDGVRRSFYGKTAEEAVDKAEAARRPALALVGE
jgi:hypothetical protein